MHAKADPPPRVDDPPRDRPVLVFDGDCGFCCRVVGLLSRRTGERVAFVPYQALGERFAAIPRGLFAETVVRVAPDGTWTRSGEASMLVLADARVRWPGKLYRRVPGVAPLVELGYRVVSGNRQRISRLFGKSCRL